MGVPRYYKEVIKKFPETIEGILPAKDIDYFLIDFNAIIYRVIAGDDSGAETLSMTPAAYEMFIINKVVVFLQDIINRLCPKIGVFIAMDGPVPLSKMVKQRARRYKTIIENNYKKQLEIKYNCSIIKNKWSSSAISPGTSFMSKLAKRLEKIKIKNLRIEFSNSNSPGEGEHKIFKYLKQAKLITGAVVIYSPDADLIVLSVMSDIKNILILRDREGPSVLGTQSPEQSSNEFDYLSIDKCKVAFNLEIKQEYNLLELDVASKFSMDYSFLTFLCGNDFVSASLFLRIKDGGLEKLIDIYKKIRAAEQLIVNNSINMKFFMKLIQELALIEQEALQKQQKRRDYLRKKPKIDDPNPPTWESDLLNFQHLDYSDPKHPQFEEMISEFRQINYYDANWINQYNNYFFKNLDIGVVCYEYYKSLVYCLTYYNGQCNDWRWYYPFRASPTFNDFYKFLNGGETSVDFENGSSFTPFEQLLMILPKQLLTLLPKPLRDVNEIKEVFPTEFKLDIVYGNKYIYAEPILPELDSDVIKSFVKKREHLLTPIEKERNKII